MEYSCTVVGKRLGSDFRSVIKVLTGWLPCFLIYCFSVGEYVQSSKLFSWE